jgi:hypothetical protein
MAANAFRSSMARAASSGLTAVMRECCVAESHGSDMARMKSDGG